SARGGWEGVRGVQVSGERLGEALTTRERVREALQAIRKGDVERGLGGGYVYVGCCGRVVVGWMWRRQAQAALRGLQGNGVQPKAFYEGKLRACEYFMRYELPKPLALAEVLEQGDRTTLEMPDECF